MTNTNTKTKNEIAVTKTNTKNTTAVAVVNNTDLVNKSVKSKLLSFDETMQLMTECGIGSKSHTKNYRIINGGTSIHVLKTKYRIYATNDDFELCKSVKSSDLTLLENDNAVDIRRPHTIICGTTEALKKVFNALSKNKLNAPC